MADRRSPSWRIYLTSSGGSAKSASGRDGGLPGSSKPATIAPIRSCLSAGAPGLGLATRRLPPRGFLRPIAEDRGPARNRTTRRIDSESVPDGRNSLFSITTAHDLLGKCRAGIALVIATHLPASASHRRFSTAASPLSARLSSLLVAASPRLNHAGAISLWDFRVHALTSSLQAGMIW